MLVSKPMKGSSVQYQGGAELMPMLQAIEGASVQLPTADRPGW